MLLLYSVSMTGDRMGFPKVIFQWSRSHDCINYCHRQIQAGRRGGLLHRHVARIVLLFDCKELATDVRMPSVHDVRTCSRGFFRSMGYHMPIQYRSLPEVLGCRRSAVLHFLYADSKDVYGYFFLYHFLQETIQLCLGKWCSCCVWLPCHRVVSLIHIRPTKQNDTSVRTGCRVAITVFLSLCAINARHLLP